MDPITIGIAFSAAQTAVKNIKQAMALGKDIHGVVKEFGAFFNASDKVHGAAVQSKFKNSGKSDHELRGQALELAMQSKALRDYERELKELLIYSGNGDVWEEMNREHTRLIKERNEFEKKQAEIKQRKKEELAQAGIIGAAFLGLMFVISCGAWALFQIHVVRGH